MFQIKRVNYKNGEPNMFKPNRFSMNFIIHSKLKVGDIFNFKEELRTCVELFGLIGKFSMSNPRKLVMKCVCEEFTWSVRGVCLDKSLKWTISKLNDLHICLKCNFNIIKTSACFKVIVFALQKK